MSEKQKNIRLTRESWVICAFDTLYQEGIDQVRIERLAKKLKVTKGSFYWHFKNRPELLDALIEYWHLEMTKTVVENARMFHGDPVQRIFSTLRDIITNEKTKYDPAIRAWANHDVNARKYVEKADKLRLTFLIDLFTDAGFAAEESEIRARMLYYYVLGEAYVTKKESRAIRLERIEKKAQIFTS
ncbi:MAG: AcrR family transcriptional regulator [Planctomycetota bacterium]